MNTPATTNTHGLDPNKFQTLVKEAAEAASNPTPPDPRAFNPLDVQFAVGQFNVYSAPVASGSSQVPRRNPSPPSTG